MKLKLSRFLLHRRKKKLFFGFIFISLISVEFFTYFLQTLSWMRVECADQTADEECVKLLFVADPQLIGEEHENAARYIGSIWDSDRYIKRTFSYAMGHVRPDAVIFLGDLLDEGSTASEDEFERYVGRFKWVFPESDVPFIILPGDNDIGGEGDPITHQKIRHFDQYFGQPDVVRVKGIVFYKVNRMRYHFPKNKLPLSENETKILLSHLPLLTHPSPFIDHLIEKFEPNLIFSGHEHTAVHLSIVQGQRLGRTEVLIDPIELELDQFQVINEIMVPTCSYRMGTTEIGFAAAAINLKTQRATVYVLPLPDRFRQLFFYVGVIIVLILHYAVIAVYIFFKKYFRRCLYL
ncbi:Hypothetical predicted protein [Cloeon dipterum]|uniref:Calcineurin-like phosphoesterase domain-containing protein n=1 Tax=Cloeon dipterum TaxID=197152 RepID=A0A8S1DH34_9INSE|nr:Hypothetical predicted protein [Cloeon dipterum]